MKTNLTFLLTILSVLSNAQTTTFKENLFNKSDKSIIVSKKSDIYILKINKDTITTTDSIYNWTQSLIKDVLDKRFSESDYSEYVEIEASKLYYEYNLKNILFNISNKQPKAGSIGFENPIVFLLKEQQIEEQYKQDIKQALEKYKNQDKPRPEYHYGALIVKKRTQIVDAVLDSTKTYSRKKLYKHGVETKKDNLRKTISSTYESFFNEMTILKTDSVEQSKAQMKLISDSLELVHFKNLLDTIASFKREGIKSKNEFGVFLFSIKEELEKKKTSPLNENILDSTLALLDKIEMWNVKSVIENIFADRENKEYFDSTSNKISLAADYNKAQISEKLNKIQLILQKNSEQQKQTKEKLLAISKSIDSYKNHLLKFKIDSIKVEITKTFIENLLIYGQIEYYDFQKSDFGKNVQKKVTLRNTFPIGISTLNALDQNMRGQQLFAIINKEKYAVPLYEVLAFYRPEPESNRRDYSPADTTFTILKDETLQTSTLKRESSDELFEFKVFSDFVGIDGTSTNGLIQTELSKEMYLNPYRFLCWKYQKHSAYWGIASFIKPSFSLSKIEQTNKYYNLIYQNDTAYIPTLTLQQYEIYNIGFDVNLAMLSLPFLKSNFYIDPGFYFGRTGVSDSTHSMNDSVVYINKQGLNNLSLRGNVRFVTQTDERYFFEIRGFYQYTSLLSSNIIQTSSSDNLQKATIADKSLLGMEFFAGYSPNKNQNGRLFVRYRYTYSFGEKDGYNQLQFGYSHYFKRKN